MYKINRCIRLVMMLLVMLVQIVSAAPAPLAAPLVQETQPIIQNIRYSQTLQQVRIVFDVTSLPEFTANLTENPDQLVVDFENTVNKVTTGQITFNDQVVSSLKISEAEPAKQQVVIDLKAPVGYTVFTLRNPNRVVIDILKDYDLKNEEQLAAGVKYTSLLRVTRAGRISGHILELTPGMGYIMKPVLSNDAVVGLEKLQAIAERNKALAAVNGSYFAPNGEIIGLLKMDGEIVSTSDVQRTAVGILANGKIMMDQIEYKGSITLPDGRTVAITGVNHERGSDDLILYNNYYDSMTSTNAFGSDYIINNGKVVAIAHGSAAIPPGGIVLSAHGEMEKILSCLKVGDTIKITQTLDNAWDKTLDVLGAGPRLVKSGNVFLTSHEEEFPSDITKGRAPRTAVGVTQKGHILLVVVDGRQQNSMGMTLTELALLMQEWGAVDAMNSDGGGSSEMVVNGTIVNKPSDGRERSVGDALLIIPQK